MKSYNTSLAPLESREDEFAMILDSALDPYLEGCIELSRELERPDGDVFSLNCLLVAKSTLQPFDFTAQRAEKLQGQIARRVNILVEYELDFFLRQSGLHPLVRSLSEWEAKVC